MRFRKKPVIVEAFQWFAEDPPVWWTDALAIEDSTEAGNAREHGGLGGDRPHALIATLEGVMRVNQEDWVIQGIHGELYPCKPDIFAETYELAPQMIRNTIKIDGLVVGESYVRNLREERDRLVERAERITEGESWGNVEDFARWVLDVLDPAREFAPTQPKRRIG